ncbi:MAG: zf-HC2 domain-containing protein [Chloroflexi bacterium]|nr:zf-HC2 domain-containing protein [Chloroflexota bacterium]
MIFGWFTSDRQHLSEEDLSAYVDGAPGAPSADRVQKHLAICDTTCSADLEGLRTMVRVLNAVAPVTAPRSFALTAEMVADLPDRKPLGEPPTPAKTGGWRMPVFVPAAASIAAAVVFALVLVGNLSGVIEQSGSSSKQAASLAADATGFGGAIEVAVEAEEVVAEMAAAPVAAGAGVPEMLASPDSRERTTMESATSVTPQLAAAGDASFAPPSTTLVTEDEVSEAALAPAPKAAPDTFTLESAPQLESPDDAVADGARGLELPPVESFNTDAGSTASAKEGVQVDAIAQAAPQIAPSPNLVEDDDFTLPVWQLLLATGIITALLGSVSLLLSRRGIPG